MKLHNISFFSFVIIFAIGLRVASSATADLSYFVLALYALRGRSEAIQALALSWFFSMLNAGIMPAGGLASIGRYSVIFCAAYTVLMRSRRPIGAMATGTLLLGLFIIGHSLLFSSVVDVSILKAAIWAISMATLSSAWSGLVQDERESLIHKIFVGLTVILFVSLPLLVHPLGYKLNGTGFQGILGHPQEFGMTMALIAVWSADMMLSKRNPSWFSLGLLSISSLLVVMSEARTGALALLLGSFFAIMLLTVRNKEPLVTLFPGIKSTKVHLAIVFSLMIVVLNFGALKGGLADFFTKRTGSVSMAEAYENSRGKLMADMRLNIKEKPIEGIGFGIGSIPGEMIIVRDPVLGLPLSAIIEKGVLPLAVLEELGVMGFSLVALWILFLLRRSVCGGFLPLAISLTILLLNMGESMLFSTSGMGLMTLILLGWVSSYSPFIRKT